MNSEIFDTITEAKVITKRCGKYYNTVWLNSSSDYRLPATETFLTLLLAKVETKQQKLRIDTWCGVGQLFSYKMIHYIRKFK